MSLENGTRVGPYEITGTLGVGGSTSADGTLASQKSSVVVLNWAQGIPH